MTEERVDFFAHLHRSITVSRGDAKDRNARVGKSGIDQVVAKTAFEGTVGAIIEFDGEENSQTPWIAQGEIDVLAGDAIERGPPAAAARIFDRPHDIGKADLGKHDEIGPNRLLEHAKERPFSGRQEISDSFVLRAGLRLI